MNREARSHISRDASWRAAICSLLLLLICWLLWSRLPGDTGANPLVADSGSGGQTQLEKGAVGRDGGHGGVGDSVETGNSPSGENRDGDGSIPGPEGAAGAEPGTDQATQAAEGSGGPGNGQPGGQPSESGDGTGDSPASESTPEPEAQPAGTQPDTTQSAEARPEPAAPPGTSPQTTVNVKPDTGLGSAPQEGTLASSNLESLVKPRDFRQPGRPYQGGNFFEVKGSARRIVYAVDFSSSMGGGKFSETKSELVEALRALPADREFYVVFFNQNAKPMPGSSRLRPANQANINEAVRWIQQETSGGGTDPRDALDIALNLNPEVVMVLSDGGFSTVVVNELRQKNGPKGRVSISTIGFYDDAMTLRQIAAENRGDYRYIPRPRG